jgi:photosystem II stability/assembly factor-like uncharacterized protein
MPTLISSPMAASSSPSLIPPARTAVPTNTGAPTETAEPTHLASDTPGAHSPQPTISEPTGTETPLPTQPPIAHIAAGQPLTLTSIHMIDANTGWAVSGVGGVDHVLRTTDGAETWRDVSPGLRSPGYKPQPFFLDAQLAWVGVSDGYGLTAPELWRTQDGGLSWMPVGPKGQIHSRSDIWFNDSQHGWKMEADVWGLSFSNFDIPSFSTTKDAGQTWDEMQPPPDSGPAYLAFVNAQVAWGIRAAFANSAPGQPNLILPIHLDTTTNGGHTWKSQTVLLPPGAKLAFSQETGGDWLDAGSCNFDSPVYSSPTIWKLALTCEAQGWVYTTINQGRTWKISPLPAGQVTAVRFITPTIGWVLAADKLNLAQRQLYQTQDGGQTWVPIKLLGWSGALDFITPQIGWVVAQASDSVVLVKTVDGGRTWQELKPSSN